MPVFAGQIINVDFDGIGSDGDAGVWTYTGDLPARLAPVFGLGAGNTKWSFDKLDKLDPSKRP